MLKLCSVFFHISFNFNVTFTTWTWRSWSSLYDHTRIAGMVPAALEEASKQTSKDPRAPCLGIWSKKDLTIPLFGVTIILINFVDGTCWQYSGNQFLWGLESINFMFFFILCFPSHKKPHRSYLPMCITTDFRQATPTEGGQSRSEGGVHWSKEGPWEAPLIRKPLSNLCWPAQVAVGHRDAS